MAPVYNPYTGDVIASVRTADANAIGGILQQARCGRRTAAALSRAARASILEGASHLVERRAESFAQLIVSEAGKTITQARKEVSRAVNTLPVRGRGPAQRRRGRPIRFV